MNDSTYAHCVGYITVPSMEMADKITDALLERRLIACANVIPGLTSKFVWKGKIEKQTELLIMFKTRSELVDEVIKVVKENHSYEVPEVITHPITKGHTPYLHWITESTQPESRTDGL